MSTVLNNDGVVKTLTDGTVLNSVFANITEPAATTNASLREKGVVKKIDASNTIGSIFYESASTSDNAEATNKTLIDSTGVVVKKAKNGATLSQVYWVISDQSDITPTPPSPSPEPTPTPPDPHPGWTRFSQTITRETQASSLDFCGPLDVEYELDSAFFGKIQLSGANESGDASCNINYSKDGCGYLSVYNYGEEIDILDHQRNVVAQFARVSNGSYDVYVKDTPEQ